MRFMIEVVGRREGSVSVSAVEHIRLQVKIARQRECNAR